MTGFLTIEDANTGNLNIINEFYCLDTSLLGESDFTNKRYDFIKISKTSNSYVLEVDNSLWTGGFYVTDSTGEYIDVTGSYSYDSTNNVLEITLSESDIHIYLYLCSFAPSEDFDVNQMRWLIKDFNTPVFIEGYGEGKDLYGEVLHGEPISGVYYQGGYIPLPTNFAFSRAMNVVKFTNQDGSNRVYMIVIGLKTRENISLDSNSVYIGQNNKVKINYSYDYGVVLSGYVIFNNNKYDIYYDSSDHNYYFNLDLKDYFNNHVELQIVLFETNMISNGKYSFSFNVDYKQVNSESDLINSLNAGSSILYLATDLTLSDDLIVTSSCKIIGEGNSIDLNGHSIILSEGVNCRLENLVLDKGDNAIIQGRNTKLDLTRVTFRNCISSKYNNQGACILCDIDINSLDNLDDYITNLVDCSFIDNHNCIVHGGLLTVTNCTYENTDITYSDKHNVGFLYQVDGEATITDSQFDINYLSDQYCLNEESIGYAQAILKIGQTASINNYEHEDFINNRFKFNNECHVFCKYYYDKIEACVYTSPVNGKESESYCYSASGTNWVFKENVQVTKASSNRENTYNPLME